ncbi:MAG: DMT family transporter [Granulosicoccus sp.]
METRSLTSEFTTGTLLVFFTVIVWGIQFPLAKHTFDSVNAFHSAVFRFSLPAIILLIALGIREGWSSIHTGVDKYKVLGLGVIGMCGAPSLIFGGLMFTRPEMAAIIVATQPLMTVLVQRLMGGPKPSLVSLLCIAVAFFGVVTVVTKWQTSLEVSRTELFADVMILLGALCFVVYTITTARFQHLSNLRLTTWSMCGGALANMLLVLILVALGLISNPDLTAWLSIKWELLFLTIVGVLGAMLTWNLGSKKVGALNAILFINLIPIVTFSIRYWQGYRFEVIELVGAAMVIGALSVQNVVMRLQKS